MMKSKHPFYFLCSAMDKYRRVPKEKTDQGPTKDTEIRVLADPWRTARNYITYALGLFNAEVCFLNILFNLYL